MDVSDHFTLNRSVNFTGNCSENNNLHIGTIAFAPLLLIQLFVAGVSNIILLALVAKAWKVNHSTNVYLLSFAIAGIMETFSIFVLLGLSIAQRWVFGPGACALNWVFRNTSTVVLISVHMLISRDRYQAVKNPLQWKPKTCRAYLYSALSWSIAVLYSASTLAGFFQRNPNALSSGTRLTASEPFLCFGIRNTTPDDSDFFYRTLLVLLFLLVAGIATLFTLAHYCWILKELRAVQKYRTKIQKHPNSVANSQQVLRVNGRDKPLHCTNEERTTKSLAVIYLVQFICTALGYIIAYVQISSLFLPSLTIDVKYYDIIVMFFLMVYFLPAVNPAILILTNKRFRKRVKDIFRCELKPEIDDEPTHAIEYAPAIQSADELTYNNKLFLALKDGMRQVQLRESDIPLTVLPNQVPSD